MDTSFLNWARGNRLGSYAGLVMVEGYDFKYGPDYTYIDIPLLGFFDSKEEKVVTKGLRNQYLRAIPACSLDVKGSLKVQVEPSIEMAEYGTTQPGYYVHPGSGLIEPGFYIQLRKDIDLADVPYAVRLYLRG